MMTRDFLTSSAAHLIVWAIWVIAVVMMRLRHRAANRAPAGEDGKRVGGMVQPIASPARSSGHRIP